jgi:hypothetical protein
LNNAFTKLEAVTNKALGEAINARKKIHNDVAEQEWAHTCISYLRDLSPSQIIFLAPWLHGVVPDDAMPGMSHFLISDEKTVLSVMLDEIPGYRDPLFKQIGWQIKNISHKKGLSIADDKQTWFLAVRALAQIINDIIEKASANLPPLSRKCSLPEFGAAYESLVYAASLMNGYMAIVSDQLTYGCHLEWNKLLQQSTAEAMQKDSFLRRLDLASQKRAQARILLVEHLVWTLFMLNMEAVVTSNHRRAHISQSEYPHAPDYDWSQLYNAHFARLTAPQFAYLAPLLNSVIPFGAVSEEHSLLLFSYVADDKWPRARELMLGSMEQLCEGRELALLPRDVINIILSFLALV